MFTVETREMADDAIKLATLIYKDKPLYKIEKICYYPYVKEEKN